MRLPALVSRPIPPRCGVARGERRKRNSGRTNVPLIDLPDSGGCLRLLLNDLARSSGIPSDNEELRQYVLLRQWNMNEKVGENHEVCVFCDKPRHPAKMFAAITAHHENITLPYKKWLSFSQI